MKAIFEPVIATSVIVALTGCSGMRLSNSNALADDVYYDGTETPRATATAPAADRSVSSSDVASYDARVASYRGANNGSSYNQGEARDFSQIQQYYANAGATNGQGSETAQMASASEPTVTSAALASDDSEGGYWVDGFNGSESDQSYAERIVRFHRPLVSVNYYSPFFTAARYSGDWNIYVDEYGSTYLVPSWSNPWYSDYYYGSGIAFDWYWGRSSWRLSWGWNSWYWGWDYGWGYNWAWGWGWPYHHHHHHCGFWGPGPAHHGAYGPGGHPGGGFSRPAYGARASSAPQSHSGDRPRAQSVTTNPNASRAAQRYRDAVSADRNSYTRGVDGSATTRTSPRVSTGSRVSNSAASSANSSRSQYSTNQRRTDSSSAVQGSSSNSRASSASSSQSSRSTYTPSRSTSRTQPSNAQPSSSRGSSYSTNSRRSSSSSSTYSPSSRQQSRSYSSGSSSSRSSGTSSRSYSGSSSSRGSGSSVRSSGGGMSRSSSAPRSSGSGARSGGGGGRSR